MTKKKRIVISLGTDILIGTPSHPLSIAKQVKRVIDRILSLPESEYYFSCNSKEGLQVWQFYGNQINGKSLNVQYLVNGKSATYEEALADLDSGQKYIDQLKKELK